MKLKSNLLKNRVVVVTHPIKVEDQLVARLQKSEVSVKEMPLISTKAIPFKLNHSLTHYDWVVFTSKNALMPFFDVVDYKSIKIATIGVATDLQLRNFGYASDFVGSGRSGADFAQELKSVISSGEKVLLALGNLASDVLERVLSDDYEVKRVNVYSTLHPTQIDETILKMIGKDSYDLITLTSPSAVHHLFSLISPTTSKLRLASIGIITSAAIRSYGYSPVVEADHQSYEGVAEVVVEWLKSNDRAV